jgi:glycerophosphoryl diester phosphodiesterase
MLLPIRAPSHFRIIAHRGASGYAPENTAAAFDLCKAMGIREIELDTRLSSDGVVVVCHDEHLGRFGHGETPVEDRASSELLTLDVGSWFSPHFFGGERMLTLALVFQRYGEDFIYHIELKGQAERLVPAVNAVVERSGLKDSCYFTSFRREHVERMRMVDVNFRLGWLVAEVTAELVESARSMGLFQLCPRAENVSRSAVEMARTVASEVRAWGVKGTHRERLQLLAKVIEAGCDGVTLDHPDWAVRDTVSGQ